MRQDSGQSYIRRVFVHTLEGTDLAYLDKVLKMDYNEITMDEIIAGIRCEVLQLWRWPKGIMLTEINHKVLTILYVIGTEFFSKLDDIELSIKTFAYVNFITRIEARTEDLRLQRIFNKYFTRGSVTYYKEI